MFLEIADVRDYARVKLNGKELEAHAWQPYRWDVTSALKAGSNDLEIQGERDVFGPRRLGVLLRRRRPGRAQPRPGGRRRPGRCATRCRRREGSRRRAAGFRPAGPGPPGGALSWNRRPPSLELRLESPGPGSVGAGHARRPAAPLLAGMVQRFGRGPQHGRARGRIAGPDLVLALGLFDEHFQSRDDRFALLPGPPDQFGLGGIVHHVENHVGRDLAVEEALVHVREHAQRRGVHQGVEMPRIELLAQERIGPADLGQGAHAVGVAAHQRDLGARVGQRKRRAARRPAVSHHQHRGVRKRTSRPSGPVTPAASVLAPRHFPDFRHTVLTAPMRRASGSTESR